MRLASQGNVITVGEVRNEIRAMNWNALFNSSIHMFAMHLFALVDVDGVQWLSCFLAARCFLV